MYCQTYLQNFQLLDSNNKDSEAGRIKKLLNTFKKGDSNCEQAT